MFEITPEDIAQLEDDRLRALVARLCEAELRKRGYSTAAVTWGGDQNAKDSGIDVQVDLPVEMPIDGYIPRRLAGFQVKKQDMPAGQILREMRPDGILRPSIAELARNDGAYIIASSQGSTSYNALAERRKAMCSAAEAFADRLALDFYDRTRLASWVNSHPGLVVWTRNAVGRAIPGWEPYGPWAYPAGGLQAEYFLDKGLRVRKRPSQAGPDVSSDAGIKEIRDILRSSGSVVRLVGLSGVGKTRFVQALFDSRIGDQALDTSLAVYTNLNNDPDPQPFSLASDLAANSARAILVIDNCPPDLHARLANLLRASPLSVLTVEYDIREDQPEGTEVFELHAASIELIETLLRHRYPKLSQVDAKTAAESSGGNARIAIALADTVGRGGSLARLSNSELFERLFVQRQGPNNSLLRTAQACALVYSFNGEDVSESKEAELPQLAAMVSLSTEEAYRDVAELLRRDLAQRRGRWRAILPHALANHLAARALQNIPQPLVESCLKEDAPARLTISFSRRLGYLDSSEAKAIAGGWLEPQGWIGRSVWNLNDFGRQVFQNSLPANPDAGLRALETNLPKHDAETPIFAQQYVLRALRSMAWDPSLFERCVALLELVAVYGEESVAKEARKMHASLFYLFLSGTHATVEQRLATVRTLLQSEVPIARELGRAALDAMLESIHFNSDYDFQFGSRSRDYGYHPKTNSEVTYWFRTAFDLAEKIAVSGGPSADAAKAVIAANFRGLWSSAGLRPELESASIRFAAAGFWRDGWLAVQQTRAFDEKDKASENFARLSKLENDLRPRDLVDQVRGRVLLTKGAIYDMDDIDTDDVQSFHSALERRNKEAVNLGVQVVVNRAAFQELLPQIVGGQGNLVQFGIGLARGAENPRALWDAMIEQLIHTPEANREIGALSGVLIELDNNGSELVSEFLDLALEDEPLARYFPFLQTSVEVGPQGMNRLIKSVELGKVPILAYANIPLGRATESVPASQFARYVSAVANAPEGEPAAVHLLSTQFLIDNRDKRPIAPEIAAVGRSLLQRMSFDRQTFAREDYHLNRVVEICLSGNEGCGVAKDICMNLRKSMADHQIHAFEYNRFLSALFKLQPKATLDTLLTGDKKEVSIGRRLIEQAGRFHAHTTSEISEAALLDWCGEDAVARYPLAASIVSAFEMSRNDNPVGWSPIAARLVHSAPDPLAVMREFISRLIPMEWSGSRSAILNTNADLLDQFDTRDNAALRSFIVVQKEKLKDEARKQLEWEVTHERVRDERFE